MEHNKIQVHLNPHFGRKVREKWPEWAAYKHILLKLSVIKIKQSIICTFR